jgi:hypothetical protein
MRVHLVSRDPVVLLRVVVDEILDVGLDEADFGEDLAGGRGPGERLNSALPNWRTSGTAWA